MSGQLHASVALSPEGRRSDTLSPPSLEELQTLVSKLREVQRRHTAHGKHPNRPMDDVEAHERYN